MDEKILKDFGRLARSLAKYSPCKRRGVACIVLDEQMLQPIAWGVNMPADGSECTGVKDACGCLHSEVQTILNCLRLVQHESNLMIASRAPCVPCATAIVNCGFIASVYVMDDSEPGAAGVAVLRRAGIIVSHLDVPEGAEIGLRDPSMDPSRPSGWKGG